MYLYRNRTCAVQTVCAVLCDIVVKSASVYNHFMCVCSVVQFLLAVSQPYNFMIVYTLASLFPHRHLSLSQTVTLCVITAGDALERTKLLHRFIEIATLLQSGKFGNLYTFISVIQGINVPQVNT